MSLQTFTRRRGDRRPDPVTTAPKHTYSQDQLRQRRRAQLTVIYTGDFDLTAEVDAIVTPLAARITALTRTHDAERGLPKMFKHLVADLVEPIHGELITGIVGWFAEADAKTRTEHLARDSGRRAAAIRLLMDLAPRPPAPQIAPEDLASGRWAEVLVDLCQPHAAPLANLLERAWRPGDPNLRGSTSRSERLCDLLREVDHAARQLELRVEKAERAKPQSNQLATASTDAARRSDAARAELRKMGIEP